MADDDVVKAEADAKVEEDDDASSCSSDDGVQVVLRPDHLDGDEAFADEGEEDLGGGLKVPVTRTRPQRAGAPAVGSAEAEAELGPGARVGGLELGACIGQGSFAKARCLPPFAQTPAAHHRPS